MLSRQTLGGGIIALLLLGGGCAAPADEPAAPARVVAAIPDFTYYDQVANLNFKMQIPKTWEKDESVDEKDVVTAFYSPFEDKNDTYRDNVVITALQIPDDLEVSVDEFVEQSHEGLQKSIEKLALKKAGEVTVGDTKATKYEFTGQLNLEGNRINIKGEEYFIIRKQRAYNFTFGAAASKFDKFKPTFEQILNAIEFK